MAAGDTYTAPADWAVNEKPVASTKLNQQVRDNTNVLALAVDGDTSTTTIKHRHLTNTLGNRPAAGEAGRIFCATDIGDGIVMIDDGANWNPLGVQVVERELTQVVVANEGDETSVYSFEFPAGLLGATGGFRFTLGGQVFFNAAGTLTVRVKLGVTTVLVTQAMDLGNDAAPRDMWLEVVCLNSAAGAQKWTAEFLIGPASNAGTLVMATTGDSGADESRLGAGYAASAEDTSAARTVDVTVDWSAADPGLTFNKETVLLELIPAA